MNREQIIEQELKEYLDGAYADYGSAKDQLERFAALVAAAERKIWAYEFAGMGEWLCVNIIEGTLGETK